MLNETCHLEDGFVYSHEIDTALLLELCENSSEERRVSMKVPFHTLRMLRRPLTVSDTTPRITMDTLAACLPDVFGNETQKSRFVYYLCAAVGQYLHPLVLDSFFENLATVEVDGIRLYSRTLNDTSSTVGSSLKSYPQWRYSDCSQMYHTKGALLGYFDDVIKNGAVVLDSPRESSVYNARVLYRTLHSDVRVFRPYNGVIKDPYGILPFH